MSHSPRPPDADGNSDLQRMRAAVARESDSLRRGSPPVWWTTLIGPPVLVLGLILALGILGGGEVARHAALTLLATFFFFGRFVILAGADQTLAEYRDFFSPAELAAMVFFLDAMTAIVVTFHMGQLFRLPWLGPRLQLLTFQGQSLVANQPWMRRATVVGVAAFVLMPLAATGSIGGSLLGRLLGLSRLRTLFAVLAGSLFGCLIMYWGADFLNDWIDRDDPRAIATAVIIVITIIVLLNWRYRRIVGSHAGQSRPSN